MLKKSIHGFFNYGLAEFHSAKPHKLLDFSSLAIWQSIHGLHSRMFFNTLLYISLTASRASLKGVAPASAKRM